MRIDIQKLEYKINYIKQNLNKLYDLAKLDEKDFIKNYKNYDSAKYNLQVSIEALIDIGNHLISRKQYRVPNSNADTFCILHEEGIIPEERLSSYIAMAKFRNMVVHLYEDIDEKEIFKILQDNLGDFEFFIKLITAKFL